MKSTMNKLYEDTFHARHLIPCDPIEGLNPIGRCYRLLPEYGRGYCWEYFINEMLSVSIIDQIFYEEQFTTINQPDYLTIGFYESISGEILTPYRKLYSGTIHAHVGVSGTYSFIHHADFPIKGISFTIMPEYYVTQLRTMFKDDYINPRDSFESLDGISNITVLNRLFMEVKNYMGSGMAANLYYKSKIDEALSIAIDYSRNLAITKNESNISQDDYQQILSVASYIDDHYYENIPLDFLTQVACMSKSKLMQCFKIIFHATISQYQQSKRLSHADSLLLNTDLSIAEIAKLVGYTNQGSFSEVYKKHMGISPIEIRKGKRRRKPKNS